MSRLLVAFALLLGLSAPAFASGPPACGAAGFLCYSHIVGNGTTLTDRSGTIVIGGTAQTVAPANAARTGFLVQNLSTGDLWVSSVGTASAGSGSIWIPAGSFYQFPDTGVPLTALSIYGATSGQPFTAREW